MLMEEGTETKTKMKICIVGAGMSGLCACKHLLARGFAPVVLEAQGSVGGVWRRTFSITKLQTPRFAFEFSDHPWPPGTPDYPSHDCVMDYFHDYARSFRLLPRIRFHCQVLGLERLCPDDGASSVGLWSNNGRPPTVGPAAGSGSDDIVAPAWRVHARCKNSDTKEWVDEKLDFHFIILCMGRFGDVPSLPKFPPEKGPQVFNGKVMHAMEYSGMGERNARELVKGKRVVVVGFQKTALDAAAEVAITNKGEEKPCTIVFRRAHWMVPSYTFWGLNIGLLYLNRLGELLAYKPGQELCLRFLSTILSPLRWGASKFCESYLRHALPLRKYDLVPKQSFYEQLSACALSTIPDNFFPMVEVDRIRLKKSPNWCFSEKGVSLDDGTEIEADIVILATGYDGNQKLKSILPESYQNILLYENAVVPLYRGVIHPRIPDIAFLGYQESLSNLRCSELGARWLTSFFLGQFALPDVKSMEEDAKAWIDYFKASSPFFEKACVGAINTWLSDQLCKDMGWNPKRKGSLIEEYIAPYTNLDYKD